MQLRYRFKQLTRNGMWTSDSVFEGPHEAAVREVIDGHVMGQARAAVEEGSGRVIHAVDARGNCSAASFALFAGGPPTTTSTGGDGAVEHHAWSRRRYDAGDRRPTLSLVSL